MKKWTISRVSHVMKWNMNNVLYLIFVIAMHHSYGYCGDGSLLLGKDTISQKQKTTCNQNDIILYDDLEWLVGKWRCVAKYPLNTNSSKISKAGELSELIVYLPYSTSDLTLELHKDPLRTITAELLLSSGELDPGYPFMIGIDTITIGAASAFALELHYSHSFNESKGIEILELSYIDFRFVFEKVSSDPGDISKKRVPGIVPDLITLRRDLYNYQVKKWQLLNRANISGGNP